MLTTRGETYKLELYKRVENSPYEYESTPSLTFKGRPANQLEKSTYRITIGVASGNDNVYVLCTNLPKDIKIKDRVKFLGKLWSVESIGYYYDNNRIVNAGIMSDEYLIERCPKGIMLQ